eukprot:1150581-Pleurochrysis_carterae.AAC.1
MRGEGERRGAGERHLARQVVLALSADGATQLCVAWSSFCLGSSHQARKDLCAEKELDCCAIVGTPSASHQHLSLIHI